MLQDHYTRVHDVASTAELSSAQKDRRIAELEAMLAGKDATIAKQAHAIEQLQSRPAGPDRGSAWQAAEIRMLRSKVAELERKVRGLEQEPEREAQEVRARAAQADAVAQRNREITAAQADKRLPGSHVRIRTALVLRGCTREQATRVYLDGLVADSGLSKMTISHGLVDMDASGQIVRELREVWRERPCKDEEGNVVRDDEGNPLTYPHKEKELWITLSDGPDQTLTKEQVRLLCPNLTKDRNRHRCPHCGGTRLVPTTLVCQECGHACTAKEAEEAEERIQERADGALVDTGSGEILHPPSPPARPRQGRTRRGGGSPMRG